MPVTAGAPGETRTPDTRIRNPLLYPPELQARSKALDAPYLVRPAGLEPAACGFEVRRSIQLSYGRISGKRPRDLPSLVRTGEAATGGIGVSDGARTHNAQIHNLVHYHCATLTINIAVRTLAAASSFYTGAPGRTRTCGPQLRRLSLYPPELRAPI